MTITSSLNASVSGLQSHAANLATISDNIANASTLGYKRVETDFRSKVVGDGGAGGFAAGGVSAAPRRIINEQMPLIGTSNPTDLAINGRGMLPVTSGAAVDAGAQMPLMLTTTGAFSPDENGVLKTPSDMALLGWPADADGSIPAFPRDSMAGLEPVRVTANQFAGDPTTRIDLDLNLPATSTEAGAPGTAETLTMEYFGNLGASATLDIAFTPSVPAAGASNEWALTVTDPADGSVIGEFTLEFDDTAASGGTLAGVTLAGAGQAYDPAAGTVGVTTAAGNDIALAIGTPGSRDGLTQLSDSFAPSNVQANGSPVGNLVSVEVDANGFVNAIYDTGSTRTIYQIPVADVPNPNGLTTLDNQAFQVSRDSGRVFLWDAGEGPTGEMAGFAREESATDVATELTNMIQTQRAYSSNASVVRTVDEMLQETTNLKR